MLAEGGSAVDAAIAAAAAVCVVHPSSCGLGGGGFALVHDAASGRDFALDYRETAPAGAVPELNRTDGKPDASKLRHGGLAIGVPGEPAGLVTLHRRFGRLPLSRVLDPAARLARDGFTLEDAPHVAREIERTRALLAGDAGLRALFLTSDGTVPGPSFRVVQPDLARTMETLGAEGDAPFYSGPIAAAIVAAARARGGVLAETDLAGYRPVWREPLRGTFRGRRIVSFPPPGSGGVVLAVLGILSHDDPAALGAGTATWLHLLAGALARGFEDRARWYGDPAFTDVPLGRLLEPARLARVRAELGMLRPAAAERAPAADAGTAHVSVVDTDGNAVAITTTINTGFGAGVLAAGTGVILNNELDDFALEPGLPNVYGLVGTEANALRPGKRPQSSMSPTIVLRGRRPELVVGGSGGPFIISGTIQATLGVTAFGLGVREAIDAPRIHDQGVPPVLLLEPGIDAQARRMLERAGHPVKVVPGIGAVAGAGLDAHGAPVAAGDRRKDGGQAVVP
jgi:gamma-glutamyltranspeptidase/glutathione hydrolase